MRRLTTSGGNAALWVAIVLIAGTSAAAQGTANDRSVYARQGQFAARTTNYSPAWKVHPKVRPQQGPNQSHTVRQARYQGEVLEPPFRDEEPSGPPFDENESGIPTEEEIIETPPVATPPTRPSNGAGRSAPTESTPAEAAPVIRTRPSNGQRPTLAPRPSEEIVTPRARSMEPIPAPHGTPRLQPEFDYGLTDEYGNAVEEYGGEYVEGEYGEYGPHDEFGDGYGSACPSCGQGPDYCQCPPHVCEDTWPCWHARRQWRNFRLFGGGWDIGCPWNWWDELSLFGGPHSFKGPLDQGRNGNFGIQEGINWGGPLWHCHGIGFQLGVQGAQSNFAGYDVNGFSDQNRNQLFATAGVFARAHHGHGWQLGVVVDWLQDEYYVDVSLDQLRAELSYVTFCGTELGGWIVSSSASDEDEASGVSYEVTNMYALFLRQTVATGGDGRIWAGATGDGDGLVGADFLVPLTNRWALSGAVNYIIPQDGASQEGLIEEAWGMTINFVWHPFRSKGGCAGERPYRPLLNVADNTMFMVERVTGTE